MAISEKAKEKLDEAGKEIREAVDHLKAEVTELRNKVKEKFKGSGEEMRESADELTQEVRKLSERVKDLVPKRRKKDQLPVRIERHPEFPAWERPFPELRDATDRFFEEFFRHFGPPMARWHGPWDLTTDMMGTERPRVDISESDKEIIVTAELPGVEKEDIDISVTDDRITIRGEKRSQEEEERGYYRFERSYGAFQRSFPIPCEVESDKVDASFKNGVLRMRMPKSQAAKERTRKIRIR